MSNSKRIAFLLSSLKFGGGERVVLNLAAALKAQGYDVDILLMSEEGEFLKGAHELFNVVNLDCNRTWKLPFKLWKYVQKSQPTAIISSFWKLNICACIAKAFFSPIKLVVWEHSPPSKSKNSPTFLYAISSSVFYQFATMIVAVSNGVASDVKRITFGLDRKVITILNPIPPPDKVERKRPSRMGKKILWVGRLDSPKNPELMLAAFAGLPASKGYTLDFVGDGILRDMLEQRVHRLGLERVVRFHGFQSNPYQWMMNSDLLVLSSDREGLPTVLIEALHAGLRSIATDCGQGVHDILGDNLYGTIVPPNDKHALKRAIELELNTPFNAELQINGAQRFSPRNIALEFLHALGLEEVH